MINELQSEAFRKAFKAREALFSEGYHALVDKIDGEFGVVIFGPAYPDKEYDGVRVISKPTIGFKTGDSDVPST